MSEDIDAFAKATTKHIIALQARVDALTAMVTLLATHLGADASGVRASLRGVEAASTQKRFEELEQLSPRLAADLDDREEMPEQWLDLLDHLRFDRREEEGGAA